MVDDSRRLELYSLRESSNDLQGLALGFRT